MPSIPRRDFLMSAVGAAAAGALSPALTSSAGLLAAVKPPASAIIDTHTHFYNPTRPQGVPWPGKDDKLLYRRILPDDYKSFAKPLGVTGTIVVEASPWIEDNQWVLDLAAKDPFVVGLVGHLRPGDDDFAQNLKRFAANRHFRGIRIGHAMLKERLDRPEFVRDLKSLADHDLELDVNGGPEMPGDVARLAERLPTLRIVINHCANVRIDGKTPPAAWHDGIRAAAKHAAVFCKVSALVEGTGRTDGKAPEDVTFYKPTLDVIWNAFGENRLIYGSNWPVSERFAPYAVVQKIVADYFADRGREASEKYFHRNAVAAYKPVAPASR